jgi:hypothetical protein
VNSSVVFIRMYSFPCAFIVITDMCMCLFMNMYLFMYMYMFFENAAIAIVFVIFIMYIVTFCLCFIVLFCNLSLVRIFTLRSSVGSRVDLVLACHMSLFIIPTEFQAPFPDVHLCCTGLQPA